MKALKLFSVILIVILTVASVKGQNQGVAINTDGSQADASAMLDVKSTTGGVLVPRMTQTERDAINAGNPAMGLLIYQTDNTPGFYYYNGSSWQAIVAGGDSDWTITGNDIYNSNSGNVGIGTSSPGAQLDVGGHIWQSGVGNSVFLGKEAGNSDNFSDNINVFLGYQAGMSTSTGENNIAIGGQSLLANSGGSNNIAIGSGALWFNGSAIDNISIGSSTSANNIGGSYNTVIGTFAFKAFQNSSSNTAIGFNALGDLEPIPWALGSYTGDRLTAIGYEALFNNQDGIRNTGLGYKALYENKSGSLNTAVGYNSGPTATNLDNTTALGSGAVPTAGNRIHVGNTTVNWIGGQVTWSVYSDERFKTNIKEDVAGLDFIMNLRPVTYNWNVQMLDDQIGTPESLYEGKSLLKARQIQESISYTGFLAQEVEQAMSGAKYDFSGLRKPDNSKDLYSISYSQFVVPLVKAVQEQQLMIDELKQQNKELRLLVEKLINE